MTTATETIRQKAQRYADLKAALDEGYRNLKELEHEIISHLRERYPDEWSAWERGRSSFRAEGVEIRLARTYDVDRFKAEMGEDYSELITTETKVVEKVDGRKAAELWKQADVARRLEKTLVQQVPKVRVTE